MYQSSVAELCEKITTVKLGNKERFDKEQIGIKEPFPVTNLPFNSQGLGTFDIKEQF